MVTDNMLRVDMALALVKDALEEAAYEGFAVELSIRPRVSVWSRMGAHAAGLMLQATLAGLRFASPDDLKLYVVALRIGRDAFATAQAAAAGSKETTPVQQEYLDGYSGVVELVTAVFD